MLGLSVYLNEPLHLDDLKQRLSQTKNPSIFTSLHLGGEEPEVEIHRLQQLNEVLQESGAELIADISDEGLKRLNISGDPVSFFEKSGVTCLRLDFGFMDQEIVQLSQRIKLAVNASTTDQHQLEKWKNQGVHFENLIAMHNFYPRPETGLRMDFLEKINQVFQTAGIRTAAFIPGDTRRRGPVYAGLPTVEEHRAVSPAKAYLELKTYGGVDDVYVGDPGLSDAQWMTIQSISDGIIPLRVDWADEDYREVIKGRPFTNRFDDARDVIRAQESRQEKVFSEDLLTQRKIDERLVGTITVDNMDYGRYAGELQIARQ